MRGLPSCARRKRPRQEEEPDADDVSHDRGAPLNPLGAKGIGEAGSIGTPAAVANAVCDALAPLGIRDLDPPFTDARVWEAIDRARSARPGSIEP